MSVAFVLVFFACALGPVGLCQEQSYPRNPVARFADRLKPSNSWQAAVVEPAAQPKDPVHQALRQARDRFADKVLGAHMPLDEMADKGVGYGGGVADYGPGREEVVPDFPNRTVVVAQFAGFDVVLSGSRSAIYTEMHLSVERVLESPVTLFPGATITAVTNGGAVRLPNGRVLEFQTRPRAFVPVPGSRYLFVLRRMLEGDFYLITKSIELRDSKVLPNSKDDVARAEEGTWPFLDLDENHVVGEVNRLLLAQKRGAK